MYQPNKDRYENMPYRNAGSSGLKLPEIQLGMWHNFSADSDMQNCRNMLFTAFDCGITLFDLANNYSNSTAENVVGEIIRKHLANYRDELLVTSKAGYIAWEGPYGTWGSKKSVIASLDRSLKKTGLEYFDIFYSHRYDPDTPLEETIGALALAVQQGKALYLGISNYPAAAAARAKSIADDFRVPMVVNQLRYNIFDRRIENDSVQDMSDLGIVCFSPLEQGLLSERYINEIPSGSRAANPDYPWLDPERVEAKIKKVRALNELARERGQTLPQMAIQWLLTRKNVCSVLIGASNPNQISNCAEAVKKPPLSDAELKRIDDIALKS